MRGRLCALLAALVYLGVASWALRGALADPTRLLPHSAALKPAEIALGHFDQSMVVSVITRNADALVSAPWTLFGDGQCYPFPQSYTLGEHMFGEGLLAAFPWALTGDPILSYNFALLLSVWIPGLTMYALAFHFTRSPPAAFVAGLLFLLLPPRLVDCVHPYIHADLWTPLALLFLHRVFVRGGILNALALGLFLALEALETIYILLACVILVLVYGIWLAVVYWRRLPRVLLPLSISAAITLMAAWLVLGPYFETRETWNLLGGRASVLLPLHAIAPGTIGFPGFVILVLALIGLIDRTRGPRPGRGEDPRWPLFLAGVLIVWCALYSVPIPFTAIELPSPFRMLRAIIPGFDAVRGLFAVLNGAWLPFALLGGYAVLALTERLGQRAALAVTALVSLVILSERFVAPIAAWNFGSPLDLVTWDAQPRPADIDLVRRLPDGPVVDVPMAPVEHAFGRLAMSRHLLLLSYNPQPQASCYNSYDTPLADQMFQLADALPDARAAEALGALGFTTVLSHTDAWWPPHRIRFNARFNLDEANREAMAGMGESAGLQAFRITQRASIGEDFSALTNGEPAESLDVAGPRAKVEFVFRNQSENTFRHPAPIQPSDLVVRWRAEEGEAVVAEEPVRAVLPVALAAGARMRVPIDVPVPELGRYRVSVARRAEPDVELASRRVTVRTPEEIESKPPDPPKLQPPAGPLPAPPEA